MSPFCSATHTLLSSCGTLFYLSSSATYIEFTFRSPTKRNVRNEDEIEVLKPVKAEADTSGDLEYAMVLDEVLKEKAEKELQAKHKQQRDDERLAQEMQMRLAEDARNSRKATVKVIEISSSDSDQDGHVVVKQECGSSVTAKRESTNGCTAEAIKRARLTTPSPHPPRPTAVTEEDSTMKKHKKVKMMKKHKKEKKRGREEGKHKHAKKKVPKPNKVEEEDSISPLPSVSPPSVSPPPSVPPPVKPAAGKNKPLRAKRGPKSRHNWTIDEYLHLAKVLSAPRFETPTVALRTLHRGHLLLDITSASVLRNAWQHLRTGVTSPLHDPRTARALEYACFNSCFLIAALHYSIQSDRGAACGNPQEGPRVRPSSDRAAGASRPAS